VRTSLTRRLEELESHIQPVGEPVVLTLEFVDAKGTVVDHKDFTVNASTKSAWSPRARTWQR
jgi:hypothetical protein